MFNITLLDFYITIIIGLSAVIGDFIVAHSNLHLYKAVFDNFTHGVIGGLSWFHVCLHHRYKTSKFTLIEIMVCTCLASLIDCDHFIAARSLQLTKAVNLPNRPPLHCSTFPLLFSMLLFCVGFYNRIYLIQRYSLLIFLSFMSHHIRDATRRGLWFYPYGSTPPVPYTMYVASTCFLPYLVSLVLQAVKLTKYSSIHVI